MIIPFIGGAYEGRSSNVAPETCINLFLENGESSQSLVGTAGSAALATTIQAEVRGGIAYNSLAYFVVGNTFYEVNSAGTATSRGTLNTSTGRVSMAHNGLSPSLNQQIMVVDGADGWIFDNTATTFTQITDGDFVASDHVVFIDGYFVFNQAIDSSGNRSDRFWITSQYDGTAIDGLDFATAEGSPDSIISLVADNRELYLFGTETLEIWYNSGDLDNTFQRFQGGFKQHGCVAGFSPSRFDNTVIWLSQNDRGKGQVVMLGKGYQPMVVSSPELNYQISTYSNIDQAFGYSYQHEGHEFYVLTFPGNDATWVFDAATKKWHRRSHQISGKASRERYNVHVYAFGEHLFGDYLDGTIYKLDGSIGTFAGARVLRERTTISISDEENRRRLSSLQLDMEEGMGAADTTISSTLGGAEAIGQTALTITSTTGMFVGQRFEVDDDDGGTHTTTISLVTDGTNLTVSDALTVASASGNAVRAYTANNDNEWSLDYSKDGGHTYGNAVSRSAGEGGDWKRRVLWRRLGTARNWIFRIQSWTPTRPVLKGLIAKMYGEK